MPSKLEYRADIDGLRAVAVLAVLFYHGGIRIFSGGYIGVDVFFVISGYLITSIIIQEIRANEFTLVGFYERRIRRIYPALFTVVAFTLLISSLLFDAADYAEIGKSAINVTLFVSNVYFWSESGYFEQPSTLKPLLHAWSLSVEEQFYILFPVLILLVVRFFRRPRIKFSLMVIAAISFALNLFNISRDASATFYLVQFRAWELLIGSLLALDLIPAPTKTTQRNLLALVGIALILTSGVLYSQETPFPGIAASIPVLGSALIIYSGKNGEGLINRILGVPPLVFVGQISYSLYLWHWPLLVIGKFYLIRAPTMVDLTIWLLATFAMSTLSWKYIEKPFRVKTFLKRPRIFVFAGSVMVLSLIASGYIYFTSLARVANSEVGFLGRKDPQWTQWNKCTLARQRNSPENFQVCGMGSGAQKPSFLLWGDSHARALATGIDAIATQREVAGQMTVMTSCPPLLGIDRPDEYEGICSKYNAMVIQYIQEHPELKTIILSARWVLSADGGRYKTEEGEPVLLVDTTLNQKGVNAALFNTGLQRTIAKLRELDRTVIIVYGIPEIGYDVPSAFSIATRTGRDLNGIIAPSLDEYLARNRVVLNILSTLQEVEAFQTVDLSKALCNQQQCAVVVDEMPLYLDNNHLSTFGAHYVSYFFDPIFLELGSK